MEGSPPSWPVLELLRGWGSRSHWDCSLLGCPHSKVAPFPFGSFSPLPHLPQWNKFSFLLFIFGVPFHIPLGIAVAWVTGFLGGVYSPLWLLSMVLGHERLWEAIPIFSAFIAILETFHFFQWSHLKILVYVDDTWWFKQYCHRTMELWLQCHNLRIWSHGLLALLYHVSDSDKISLPLAAKLGESSDPTQVSFGDAGLPLWTFGVSTWISCSEQHTGFLLCWYQFLFWMFP